MNSPRWSVVLAGFLRRTPTIAHCLGAAVPLATGSPMIPVPAELRQSLVFLV
jgi:hypothetical protein